LSSNTNPTKNKKKRRKEKKKKEFTPEGMSEGSIK
jgi:hypothetical protein